MFSRRRYVSRPRRAQGSQRRRLRAPGYPRSGFGRGTTSRNFLSSRIPAYLAPGYGFAASNGSDITSDRYRVKQKYTAIINLATSSGVSTPYIFRGNSVYDPDFTSTGWVATGFTAMSQLYQRYLVTGSKMTIKAVQTSGTSPGLLSFVPTLSSSALSNYSEDYASNPWGKNILVSYEEQPSRPVSTYMSTSRLYGESVSATGFASDVNTVPSNQVNLLLLMVGLPAFLQILPRSGTGNSSCPALTLPSLTPLSLSSSTSPTTWSSLGARTMATLCELQ